MIMIMLLTLLHSKVQHFKKARKESLSDATSGAAVAIVRALPDPKRKMSKEKEIYLE